MTTVLWSVLAAVALQVPPVAKRVPHAVHFGAAGSEDRLTLNDDLFWLRDDTRSSHEVLELLRKENEYSQSAPEPRKRARRAEQCITNSLMESVARVFLFRQTSVVHAAGAPVPSADGTGGLAGQPFDIGQLWDVLRVAAQPARDVVRSSWESSLDASTGTSEHGLVVMSSLCSTCNLSIDRLFAVPPTLSVESMVGCDVSRQPGPGRLTLAPQPSPGQLA